MSLTSISWAAGKRWARMRLSLASPSVPAEELQARRPPSRSDEMKTRCMPCTQCNQPLSFSHFCGVDRDDEVRWSCMTHGVHSDAGNTASQSLLHHLRLICISTMHGMGHGRHSTKGRIILIGQDKPSSNQR